MRSLYTPILADLQKKFVFLAGPRQVGKTYLAKELMKSLQGQYYNWDLAEDRQVILSKAFIQEPYVVLDEFHKYDRWKNFLKGVYDKYHEELKILVTGSARLDIYRRGGDSLLGRYYLFHLHPFSVGELSKPQCIPNPESILSKEAPSQEQSELFLQLLELGGFPHPFLSGSRQEYERWTLQRNELLVREDIRDLTHISLLSLVEHLLILLPHRAAGLLSINSLREDLQVSYNTLKSWIETLEKLYILFTLPPWTEKISRSIHKEKKMYLWDWAQIKDEGARFENMVAAHLFKAIHFWRDLGFGNFGLYFVRDRDRREVDFLISKDHKPLLLVETKVSETQMSESLISYAEKLRIPAIQLVQKHGLLKKSGAHWVMSADRWLTLLP